MSSPGRQETAFHCSAALRKRGPTPNPATGKRNKLELVVLENHRVKRMLTSPLLSRLTTSFSDKLLHPLHNTFRPRSYACCMASACCTASPASHAPFSHSFARISELLLPLKLVEMIRTFFATVTLTPQSKFFLKNASILSNGITARLSYRSVWTAPGIARNSLLAAYLLLRTISLKASFPK